MEIQDLIPFLEKSARRVNIAEYKGCCVAIDAYWWLHKGTYACVENRARGEKWDAYVQYCMKYVNMLLSRNIKPILVFDGRHLPAKAGTEKKMRESREFIRKQAAELFRAGRVDEAYNHLRRCMDVTHEMVLALMRECRRKSVECIVAQYEADAELARLNIKNIAQIVITEDTDLALFGCSKILFKMDVEGNGLLVERDRLRLAMSMQPEQFTFDKFHYMGSLSGCDYLPSLPGIGLGKTCKFISHTLDDDIYKLNKPEDEDNVGDYAGRMLPPETGYQLAPGNLDPFTLEKVDDFNLDTDLKLYKPEDEDNVGDYAGKMLPPETGYQLAPVNLDPFTLVKVDDFNLDTDLKEGVVAAQSSIWVKGGEYKSVMKVSRTAPMFEMHRPSTKGKIVELSSNCLLTPKKRILEEIKEECTEAELESLYSKKQCVEELAEKENSPQKLSNTESEATSPVLLTSKKTQQNPFLKQLQAKEPEVKTEVMRRKPGALSEFSQAKRTEIDKSVIVQSRFFSRGSNVEKKETESTTEKCRDNKPQTLLGSLENELQDRVCTFTSPLQSFKRKHELSSQQDSITLTAAAKRDFKLPVKKTETVTVSVTLPARLEENGNISDDEEEILLLDSGIEMASQKEIETTEEDCKMTSVTKMSKKKNGVLASPKMCRRPGLRKAKK